MPRAPTVTEVAAFLERRQNERSCPTCSAAVSIRGFHGSYRWVCPRCDAVGFGYPSRRALRDAICE